MGNPFDPPASARRRIASVAQMNWFESVWRSFGIRSESDLARRIRIASRSSLGQDSMIDHVRDLSANFTAGFTPEDAWYDPPLLWWLEHPEFMEALEVVLKGACTLLTESYWAARGSHRAGAIRAQTQRPFEGVQLVVVDRDGTVLAEQYTIPYGLGLPRVGDYLDLDSDEMSEVTGVTWRKNGKPIVTVERKEEEEE